MPTLMRRTALLFASCSFILTTTAVAQDKAAPKTMQRTTSSAAAKAALGSALEEVTNIGGGRRTDAMLAAIVAADPAFALGRAWYGAWASTLTPAERQTELSRALRDAASSGTTAELIFIAGLRESQAGRNQVARQLFDVVLTLTPDDPDVTWARMLIAADDDEARRLGEAGIKRFPGYAPIYNILAYQLHADGRAEQALQTVARYAELAPSHPNPQDSYAEILQLNGRLAEADQHYARALELDPQFDEALIGRAEIAIQHSNYALARTHLEKALAMAATPARRQIVRRDVAASFLLEGKLKDARQVMTQIVADADANSLNALPDRRTVAFIAALEGRKAEAGQQFTAGTAQTPGLNAPLDVAILNALLKQPAEVARAVAAMEANAAGAPDNAAAQQAMRAARVIGAVMNKDLETARSAHEQVTGPAYKALSGAFLGQAARKAGNAALAQSAQKDVDSFKDLSLNAGLARLIARRN